MRIRRLLIAGTSLSLLAAGFGLLLSVLDARQSKEMDQADASMRLITHHASDLLVLAQDYVLHASPRAARQWLAVHGELNQALQGFNTAIPLETVDIDDFKRTVNVLPELFSTVQAATAAPNSSEASARMESLTDHLVENTRRVSDDAYEVTVRLAEQRRLRADQRRQLALALEVLMFALVAGISAVVARRVLRPIERLRANAGAVKGGDFTARLDDASGDELGDLSRDFDGMTQTLQQREAALQDSARHTQIILDNVVDGIITINDAGIVNSFNCAAETIFGHRGIDVIGRNVAMLMPEPYHSEHDGYLHTYHQTGVPRIIGKGREVQGVRKDGSIFPMDLAVSNITLEGRPLFIGVVRDITERKQVDEMKSEFVSTVSHELRTPLTSISGSLGLIIGGALGALPPMMKPMIDIAHKNSLRLSHLINDLLDMEKMAAGKINFDFQVQPLLPLIMQSLESTRDYGAQYQVTFVIDPQARVTAENIQVRVDSSRLQQVLANYLSNAAKFSPAGAQVAIDIQQRGKTVRVEVIDQGPGIPQEFRARVFQKFSQADSSDTRQKGGTGLGLAITKELIERMNGLVGFSSTPGQGARFHFELPVWTPPAAIATAVPATVQPGAPRLLVVEDEPDIASLLVALLNDAGYQTDVAHDGESALRKLAAVDYAAMTLDLMLPDQSGVALMRQIRSDARTAKLPIVVVSAHADDGRLAVNGEFNAIDWLDKPFDQTRLVNAVYRAVFGSSARSKRNPRVLHVEDDADLPQVIAALTGDLVEFDVAQSLAEARLKLSHRVYDVIILDIGLPDGSGWELVTTLSAQKPAPAVIVLSGAEVTAVQQAPVYRALVKSPNAGQDLVRLLKELLAAVPAHSQELKP